MADRYIDHGIYTYAAVPVWGVPQEGDGTTPDAATASATCSVDLSAAAFVSGTSQVSVMGCTGIPITASANGATNIQFSAVLTTMIDNIVTVINTLATATIAARPAGWATPQVRDAVFARRVGNTIELMTRSGSASWNGLNAITWAGVTGAASGVWAGGSGGCWGYIFNSKEIGAAGVLWPSAQAQGAYSSLNQPLAGLPSADDTTWARARDNFLVYVGSVRYMQFRANLCVDSTGVIWPSAAGKRLLIGQDTSSGYGNALHFQPLAPRIVWSATSRGGLVIWNCSNSSSHSINFTISTAVGGRSFSFRNVLFLDEATSGSLYQNAVISFGVDSAAGAAVSFNFLGGCEYRCMRAVTNIGLFAYGNTGNKNVIAIDDLDFVFPAASGIQLGMIPIGDQWSLRASNVRMSSPATFALVRRGGSSQNWAADCQVDNIRGFDTRLVTTVGNQGAFGGASAGMDRQWAIMTNIGPDSGYRIEGNTHIVDWLPGNQYPSLDCTTPGGTGWSWRWGWSGDTNLWSNRPHTNVVRLNARSIAGTAVRTVSLEMLVPSGMELDTSLISLRVSYEGTAGMGCAMNASPLYTGAPIVPIPASDAVWDKGAYPSYVPIRLSIETPTAVLGGSDMVVELVCSGPCPGGANSLFVNPRVSIT